jgi:hypothetical protein
MRDSKLPWNCHQLRLLPYKVVKLVRLHNKDELRGISQKLEVPQGRQMRKREGLHPDADEKILRAAYYPRKLSHS